MQRELAAAEKKAAETAAHLAKAEADEKEAIAALAQQKIPAVAPPVPKGIDVQALLEADSIELDVDAIFSLEGTDYQLQAADVQEIERRKKLFSDELSKLAKQAFEPMQKKIQEIQQLEKQERVRLRTKRLRGTDDADSEDSHSRLPAQTEGTAASTAVPMEVQSASPASPGSSSASTDAEKDGLAAQLLRDAHAKLAAN